jgi:hypothetical protein
LLGEKFGALSTAMICAGTIMVCVTRSRAMISIASVGVELALQDVARAEIEARHQGHEGAVEDDRAGVQDDRLRLIRHAEANSVQYIERTKWLCMMPFGRPVVPLVYMMLNRSSWADRDRPNGCLPDNC